jgi:uncharacterized protein YukE
MADIDVSPEALRTHAGEVDDLMTQLEEAVREVNDLWDPRAFGIVGMFLAQTLRVWTTEAKNAVDRTAESGHEMAARLRDCADTYTESDEQHKREFERIGGGGGGGARTAQAQ